MKGFDIRRKKEREIITLGMKTGNPFLFWDLGSSVEKELPKQRDRLQQMDTEEKEIFIQAFKILRIYISSPIFSDSFGVDHGSRREWEKNNLGNLSPGTLAYYESNRLGINNINSVLNGIFLLEQFSDSKRKKALQEIYRNLPAVFREKNREGSSKYSYLPDIEKVEAVKLLSGRVEQALNVLQS